MVCATAVASGHPNHPQHERPVRSREMAGLIGCSVDSLERWRDAGIIVRGVVKGLKFVRYIPSVVLQELKEHNARSMLNEAK